MPSASHFYLNHVPSYLHCVFRLRFKIPTIAPSPLLFHCLLFHLPLLVACLISTYVSPLSCLWVKDFGTSSFFSLVSFWIFWVFFVQVVKLFLLKFLYFFSFEKKSSVDLFIYISFIFNFFSFFFFIFYFGIFGFFEFFCSSCEFFFVKDFFPLFWKESCISFFFQNFSCFILILFFFFYFGIFRFFVVLAFLELVYV